MIYINEERRKHPRLQNNVPVKISGDDFDIVTETRNLSCVGAYCRVNKYLAPMTKLKIHLLLPLKKKNKDASRKVFCQGVVVRAEQDPTHNYFNIAVFFNEIQTSDRKLIADYVDKTLKSCHGGLCIDKTE